MLAAAALDDLTLVSTRMDSANRRRPARQRACRQLKHECSHAHTIFVLKSNHCAANAAAGGGIGFRNLSGPKPLSWPPLRAELGFANPPALTP
jgi:hypothetical protein